MVKKKRWESGILLPEIAIKEQVSFNIKNIPFKYPKVCLISESFSPWLKFPKKVPNHAPEPYPPKELVLRGVIGHLFWKL